MVAESHIRLNIHTDSRCFAIGGVMSLSVFGHTLIILNSTKAAFDLLDKRSSIYSDRPHLVMAGDL
jgi:hypothetical protein